jgi:ribosomal protein L17
MAGRPPKEKSFANMLNIAIKEAIEGTDKTKLRAVADALVDKAMSGDVQAIKEVADRIDGKVPQGVIGGDEDDSPINVVTKILLVAPGHDNNEN